MIDRVQSGVTLFAEAAVGRRRRDGHRSRRRRRRRRAAGRVERERYLVVRPVVVAMLHGDAVVRLSVYHNARTDAHTTSAPGTQFNRTKPARGSTRTENARRMPASRVRASRFGADNTPRITPSCTYHGVSCTFYSVVSP